jgi:predicted DsbA family dithiol-disulfide isomerase
MWRNLVSDKTKVEVFYDYGCPYVHAAALWLKDVKCALGDDLEIAWRYFPLDQVNSAEGPEWKLWEQPKDYVSRGRGAFHGAIAARNQGEEAFLAFHYGLLRAKHIDGKNHGRRNVVVEVARSASLDMARFEHDLDDYSLLSALGTDYEYARNELGVFGTPTLVFEDGSSAYLKMLPPSPAEEALENWALITNLIRSRPYIAEIKRPVRPSGND